MLARGSNGAMVRELGGSGALGSNGVAQRLAFMWHGLGEETRAKPVMKQQAWGVDVSTAA